MLTNLYVKNIALIDEVNIDFDSGLTILTGETGAGKSIILGAISLALGISNKPASEIIRKGEDTAICQLMFYFSDIKKIEEVLEKIGIDVCLSDNEILIQRTIKKTRSTFKINGISVTASAIKELAPFLLDLNSQRDNLLLLKNEEQLNLVTKFIKEDTKDIFLKLKETILNLNEAKKELSLIGNDENLLLRELEILEYEQDEIERADLKISEDEKLENIFSRLDNMQKIRSELANALSNLSNNSVSAKDLINEALSNISYVSSYDESLKDIYDALSDADEIISDVVRNLNAYVEDNEYDEYEYENISNRLDLINSLKRKYKTDIAGILKRYEKNNDRIYLLKNADEKKEALLNKISDLEKDFVEISDKITSFRKKAGEYLKKETINVASSLNFSYFDFDVRITKKEDYYLENFNDVEFLVSTNRGEELKPLKNVASGGELSRIMLAIKTAIARFDNIDTLIFDEIDTGISGRTAQLVAEKMTDLSRSRQIICITHLPQIAAMADNHMKIEKNDVENNTKTSMYVLEDKEMIEELARLLGGVNITKATYENATEMKELANNYKTLS